MIPLEKYTHLAFYLCHISEQQIVLGMGHRNKNFVITSKYNFPSTCQWIYTMFCQAEGTMKEHSIFLLLVFFKKNPCSTEMIWNKTIIDVPLDPSVSSATEEMSTVTSWINPCKFPKRLETSHGLQTSMVAIPTFIRSFSFSFNQGHAWGWKGSSGWMAIGGIKLNPEVDPNLYRLLTVLLPGPPGMLNVAMHVLGTPSWCEHPGIVF